MGLGHWAYVAMLAFCLVGTLPLDLVLKLGVLRQVRRLCLAIVPVAAAFVCWDLAATHAGQWRFDAAQTLPPRVLGLPLEELAFFLVIPLAGILSYEAVRSVHERPDPGAPAGGRGRALQSTRADVPDRQHRR